MKKRKKLIVSCLVLVCVLMLGGIGIWIGIEHKKAKDILAEVEWYDLDDKEFTITTPDELYDVAALSQYYDFKGQTIKLGADIIVNDGDASKWGDSAPESVWSPITKFAGKFDGKGYTISGIYAVGINKSVGLFTDTEATCEIQNIRLENSYIKGLNDKGTGSIIGSGTGTLTSIYSNAIVVCEADNCGGLIGYLKATKSSSIENCWFDGSVEATSELSSYTGGLVGRVLANSSLCKIQHCLNTADVTSKGQEVGGFIGAVAGETTMWLTDCLNVGNIQGVEGNLTAGMAIGKLYSSANVNSRTSWTIKGNYTKTVGTVDGTVKGVLTTISEDEVQGFDAYVNTTLDFDKYWAVVETDTPILAHFAVSTPSVAGLERKYDISWYDEKSTQMHISTVAQLNGLALLSQAYGFSGQTIILDKDLVLNEGSAKDWKKTAPENEWTMPIGRWVSEDGVTSGVAFSGTFDGNGHKISGLYINLDSKKAYNWGLFAKTKGTIKNLRLENSYIAGLAGGNVGSIAGGLEGATLENVYSNAIIDMDTWRLGGLTGIIEGRSLESTITNCWFDGSVYGRERVGGLVGNLNQDTLLTVSHCLNSGDITATSNYVGGLIGIINKCTASVTDSLNTGVVLRAEGNRTGYYGAIAGGVNGGEGVECETTFKNVFFLDDSCTKGYQVDRNNVKYVTLIGNGAIQLNEEELTGKNAYAWSSLDFKTYWTTVSKDMPALRVFAKTTQSASGTKMADYSWYTVSGKKYKISNPKQLWAFSILSRTDDFAEKTVNLTADIALNNTSDTNWYEVSGLTNWKPIGRNVDQEGTAIGKAFAGTFEGNGHKISGLYINLNSTKAFNWGLFAKISGKIQNLKLVDSHISGVAGGSVGSVTGSMAGATLENVYSNATVNITSEKDNTGKNIAGLSGIIEGKASSVITNCWFDGSVSGVQRVGGFVGSIDAASDLTISHGLNTGSVASSSNYVGGLCGLMNKSGLVVTDSLNTGAVTTTSKTSYYGAIAGGLNGAKDAEGAATFTDVYFLDGSSTKAYQVDGNNKAYVTTNGNGVVLLKDEELTGNNAYVWSMLDFDKYWTIVEKDMPMLQTFAEKIQKASGEKQVAFDWHKLEEERHEIANAKELWGFTLLSRTDDFSGEKISLDADIDFNKAEWKPIGRYVDEEGIAQGKTFAGTFNGQGHEISGLYINLNSTKAFNWGLFAKISGKIQNLKLVDSEITGVAGGSIGSVTGSMAGATLENIYSNATVTITSEKANTGKNIAGLAGIIEGKATSAISNCWFDGTVSGVERVGGFAGSIDAESELSVSHGLNSGTVTSSSNYVGGICGLMNKSGIVVKDSLNTGTVSTTSGSSYVGAIVGGLNGAEGAEGAATFDDTYYLVDSSSKAYQVNNNNQAYVTMNGVGVFGVIRKGMLGENALTSTTLDFQNFWITVKDDTPVLALLTNGSIAGKVSADISWYSEDETEFRITTREQLCGFALLSQSYTFENQTINLDADIDLDGVIWSPIGQYVNENGKTTGQIFAGTFNGNNHTISGLGIEVDTSKVTTYGMFGKVSGTIENLNLAECTVTGVLGNRVGSLVGSLAGGTLSNVCSDVTIDVTANYVGGLVGIIEGTAKGTIDNCQVTGSVAGNKHVGGLVGLVNGSANVEIAGSQNGAKVHSSGDYVGGLVGYVNKGTASITDSSNTGDVTTDSTVSKQGAIIGCINGESDGSASVTLSNIYFLEGNHTQGYYLDAKDITNEYVSLYGNGVVLLKENELSGENVYTKADFSWYDLSKTEHTISSAEQLLGFALLARTESFANQTITLGDEIDLSGISWEPIGAHEYASGKALGKAFAGTFDGGNHKITNLAITVENGQKMYGLFGQITGTIQNLTMEGCAITGTASGKVGSVVGSMNGGKLINVHSTADINVSSNFAGGLVGCLESNKTGSLTNCSLSGSVIGNKHVGGLVGFSNTGAKLTITTSQNNAAVSTKVNDSNVGGLIGYVQQSTATIKDSSNNGTVSANNTNSNCGTIIGNINGDDGKTATVTFGNATNLTVGGMQGYHVDEEDLTKGYVTISGYVADTSWYDANKTNFTITTKEQLAGLAKLSESYNFSEDTITLGADIELNNTTDTADSNWYDRAMSWTPIGSTNVFAGTFDGNNKTITGLCIKITKGNYYGLFAKVSGTIQNLEIENAYITGKTSGRVGSVVGTLSGNSCKLINVHSDAYINLSDISTSSTANFVGGLVGAIDSNAQAQITDCWVTGSVYGAKHIGGLVGYTNAAKKVEMIRCINNASVSASTNTNVGGLIGYALRGETIITDCLNAGEVDTSKTNNGATIGLINGNTSGSASATLKNVYYLENGSQTAYKKGTTDATAVDNVVEKVTNGANIDWYTTINGPQAIETESEFLGFQLLAKIKDFSNETVSLGSDILLTSTNWQPIGYHEEPTKVGKVFAGTFDGKNHKINNLRISVNIANAKMYGLFGKVSGTIQNLKLETCTINATVNSRVGSVVGSAEGSVAKLSNIHSNAQISAPANQVGGIIGMSESGATIDIDNCWFTGSVSGKANVGGIIGFVDSLSTIYIDNCLNSASVTSTNSNSRAGGLCGYALSSETAFTNNLNIGLVTATGDTMEGAIIGYINGAANKPSTATFTNNYYLVNGTKGAFVDGSKNTSIVNPEQCYPKESMDLSADNVLSNLGLDSSIWTADTTTGYPILKPLVPTNN